jgi:DNA adenine methylase
MRATKSVPGPMKPIPTIGRPFLKWAGGKGQLLERLAIHFPKALANGTIHTYYEPFLGGGAVFFHVMQNYPIKFAHLMDANPELVLTYSVVQNGVDALIKHLGQMERDYLKLSEIKRRERFLKVRASFNREHSRTDFKEYSTTWVERAAQIIFLNKTCYNGLFRVNRDGGFNVPFGSYTKPTILDETNLRKASSLLEKAQIRLADFSELKSIQAKIKSGSFIYYDPPYRPLTSTSSFTAYSRSSFGDAEQMRLAEIFAGLDRKGIYQMLSNSDPKNSDPEDDFFEQIYPHYRNTFYRVPASRSINSNPLRRGRINEIVITNYKT